MESWGQTSTGAEPPSRAFADAARALRAEPGAADSLSRLLSLAAALSSAATVEQVTDALLSRAASPLGAEYAALWLPDDDAAVLACVRGPGADPLRVALARIEREAKGPGGEALLAGEPLWFSSGAELARAFPALEAAREETGTEAWVGLPLRLQGRTTGLVALGFASRAEFGEEDRALHRAIAHLTAHALEHVRLLESERRARARAEAAARIAAALAGGDTLERAVGGAIVSWAGALRAADAALWLEEGGLFRCVAASPSDGRVGCSERPGAPLLARAAARGATVSVTTHTALPHERLALASAGLGGSVACPVLVRGEVRGVLCVGFAASAAPSSETAAEVESFAAHCAVALERAELLRTERAIRRRLELAHALATALASARTTPEILEVALGLGVSAFGATAGVVAVAAGDALEIAGGAGYPKALLDRWRRIPLDVLVPLVDAWRRGEPVWLSSLEEALARYPALRAGYDERNGAWAALPLPGAEGPLGVLGLSFARPDPLDGEDRAAALALARTCGLALDRARATDAERRQRREAEAARAEAERVGALQEQLVAVLGHDLRQPLSAIVLSARLLSDGARSEAQHRLLSRIARAADRMANLIRDLLDLSRARQGISLPVEGERVDLAALATRAAEEAEALQPGRVRVDAAAPVPVSGDRSRLGQVIANLLGNALEHGERSGPATVAVRREGEDAVLEVRNAGVVPPQVLARVFEPFARGNGRRGLGLGLFIAREIVRAHRGSIEMTSSEPEGTVVRVRLPAAPPP